MERKFTYKDYAEYKLEDRNEDITKMQKEISSILDSIQHDLKRTIQIVSDGQCGYYDLNSFCGNMNIRLHEIMSVAHRVSVCKKELETTRAWLDICTEVEKGDR